MDKKRQYVDKWISDYDFKTFVNSFGSTVITFAFAVFNFVIGIQNRVAWNMSIAVYFLALSGLRSFLILSQMRARTERQRSVVTKIASASLLLIDLTLIVPIAVLVREERDYTLGLIPAIAAAAYTTYKITMAAINQRAKRRSDNSLVKLLRTVNFIDALLSIVVLQNILIMLETDKQKYPMKDFSAVTSGIIWVAIVAISVMNLRSSLKKKCCSRLSCSTVSPVFLFHRELCVLPYHSENSRCTALQIGPVDLA